MANRIPKYMHNCTGCMVCADICPKHCITSKVHKDGHIYPEIDAASCVNCGLCYKVCPVITPVKDKSGVCYEKGYCSWANNVDIRENSASGGVFAEIASEILKRGGFVVGATMKNSVVEHLIIDKHENLHLLQGTKYQQGDLKLIYRKCIDLLTKGNIVLFSGVPCQVAAITRYAEIKHCEANLYTIDLICGGFPSILPLQIFLNNENDVVEVISYRSKKNGWKSRGFKYDLVTIDKGGNEKSWGDENIVIGSFCTSLTSRRVCSACPFAKNKRGSDLTIGDYWGECKYPEQHKNGVSAVVVHNQKGDKLLCAADVTIKETSIADIVKSNYRLQDGRNYFIRLHPAWIFRAFILNHFSYKKLKFIYNATSERSILSILYRSILYLCNKMNSFVRKYF